MVKQVNARKNSRLRYSLLVVAIYVLLVYSITAVSPPPRAVSMGFEPKSAQNVTFLADLSWIDASGQRQLEQQIFDAALDMIANARKLIVLDMFLFNDWQGPVRESHRTLSQELTDALIKRKRTLPSLVVTVISDPVNAVYGGLPSVHFEAMRAAGIDVVLTDLTKLQDSNPLYSGLWRWLIRPFGNAQGSALPNPFGPGKVSIRSYLTLLNFKANHRKLLVVDGEGGELTALVSSANPHDGSSAHRNVAMTFTGNAVLDVLVSETALLTMSGATASWQAWPVGVVEQVQAHRLFALTNTDESEVAINAFSANNDTQLQVVSESRIEDAVITMLLSAESGDKLDLLMFYLSDRDIVNAIKAAHQRGVSIRVLLDVNQDAFGRKKKGVPNRPVAAELARSGIDVRWCATAGEQCHAKMLYRIHKDGAQLLLGSGNYTRRNLEDFNLETNVWLQTPISHPAILNAAHYFEVQWSNLDGRTYSVDYEQYENDSTWLKWRYRFMEATGFGTF